ncbi:MAG: rhodanese-like domain-containing protein [Bacteroidota bacterium]
MFKLRSLLSVLFVALLIVSSCKKPVEVNEAEVLATYLESTENLLMKDYVNTDLPSIMPASEVKTLNETGQVYILDIRAAADFTAGHIANAHNVALADVLAVLDTADLSGVEKIAVVCYTGQTAGFATCILRLMGYDNAFSMKWGMCAWNEAFAGKWNTAIAGGNAYATQFTDVATEKNATGELPVLETGKETGLDILTDRANAVLTEGFGAGSVSSATLFGNLEGYYIVNYWPADQYADPGHIPGAVQYTPKETLKLAADLKTLPTDKPIAVYCYTGQTSAFITAYLRLLGYDAKSVLFGTNGMIYDIMVSKTMTTFSAAQIMGYDYVTE